jgi:hypothetical protein
MTLANCFFASGGEGHVGKSLVLAFNSALFTYLSEEIVAAQFSVPDLRLEQITTAMEQIAGVDGAIKATYEITSVSAEQAALIEALVGALRLSSTDAIVTMLIVKVGEQGLTAPDNFSVYDVTIVSTATASGETTAQQSPTAEPTAEYVEAAAEALAARERAAAALADEEGTAATAPDDHNAGPATGAAKSAAPAAGQVGQMVGQMGGQMGHDGDADDATVVKNADSSLSAVDYFGLSCAALACVVLAAAMVVAVSRKVRGRSAFYFKSDRATQRMLAGPSMTPVISKHSIPMTEMALTPGGTVAPSPNQEAMSRYIASPEKKSGDPQVDLWIRSAV